MSYRASTNGVNGNLSVPTNNFQSPQHHQMAIRQEIQRFESVHPNIYAVYDLVDLISDPVLAQEIREHIVAVEGKCLIQYSTNNRHTHKLLFSVFTNLHGRLNMFDLKPSNAVRCFVVCQIYA